MTNFLPINGSAEIMATEGNAHMLLMMDRIEQAAMFSPAAPVAPKHADAIGYYSNQVRFDFGYVGTRCAAE